MNIFDVINQDHDKQRTLAKALVKTSGDSEERRSLFEALKQELVNHAIAEEQHFYKYLIEGGAEQEHTRHGMAEHHTINKMLADLEETEYDSPGWLVKAKELKHKILHHLEDEEQTFFPNAGKVLNEQQKEQLAELFVESKYAHSSN